MELNYKMELYITDIIAIIGVIIAGLAIIFRIKEDSKLGKIVTVILIILGFSIIIFTFSHLLNEIMNKPIFKFGSL